MHVTTGQDALRTTRRVYIVKHLRQLPALGLHCRGQGVPVGNAISSAGRSLVAAHLGAFAVSRRLLGSFSHQATAGGPLVLQA